MTAETLNSDLIAQLKEQQLIRSAAVEQAFYQTPRHLFVPHVALEDAYQDRAIPTKFAEQVPISSCSQPAIVAIMLEQLDVREGMNVLEVGAGTGYNAALLARLVGSRGHVTSIDIDDDTVHNARAHLQSAQVHNVEVVLADGGEGFAARAPFDRIVLTVGASDIAPAWLEQLAAAGVLLLPWWFGARQYSIAFYKSDGHLRSRSVQPCGFMPLRGNFAGPPVYQADGDLNFGGELISRIDTGRVRSLIAGERPRHRALAGQVHADDLLDWLSLQGALVFTVVRERWTYALSTPEMDSVALFDVKSQPDCEPAAAVNIFGSEGSWQLLDAQLDAFARAHCPSVARGIVEAYRLGTAPATQAAQFALRKRWMEYVLTPAITA